MRRHSAVFFLFLYSFGVYFGRAISCDFFNGRSQTSSLSSVNSEDPRFQDLMNELKYDPPKSVTAWLESLATRYPKYFSRYALVYASGSRQHSTVDEPRVILFGDTAKVILTFNAQNKSRLGHGVIEIANFNEDDKTFQFREVNFKADGEESKLEKNEIEIENAALTISVADPLVCMDCHSNFSGQMHPIWDTYPLWPGVFGSNDEDVSFSSQTDAGDPEKFGWSRFSRSKAKKARYNLLRPFENNSAQDIPGPNESLNIALGILNAQRIANWVATTKSLEPFRYAMLGTLLCSSGQGEQNFRFVASKAKQVLPDTYPYLDPILINTVTTAKSYLDEKYERSRRAFDGAKNYLLKDTELTPAQKNKIRNFKLTEERISRLSSYDRTQLAFDHLNFARDLLQENYDVNSLGQNMNPNQFLDYLRKIDAGRHIRFYDRLTRLRNIIEGAGESTSSWPLTRFDSYNFNTGAKGGLERVFLEIAKRLVAELPLGLGEKRSLESCCDLQNRPGNEYYDDIIFDEVRNQALCQMLETRSKASLESMSSGPTR